MAEIPFEYLAVALESTRGTPVTPPTHKLPLTGTITPKRPKHYANDPLGTLSEYSRSSTPHKWGELSAEGDADCNTLIVLANQVFGPVTVPTTPGGGTLSRLWTFPRIMTADTIKSATYYWGDPNQQIFQGEYGMLDSLEINGDASSEDPVKVSISGMTHYPAPVAAPVVPATVWGGLVPAANLQVWIDTSSAWGTTEITGRDISASLSVPTGVTYKYMGSAPATSRNYTRTGRVKTHPTTTVAFDFVDMTQYNQFDADTYIKLRVRFSGDLIETTLYDYIQWDCYGKLTEPSPGDMEGSNRTWEFTLEHEYHPTLASDTVLYVENQRTSL